MSKVQTQADEMMERHAFLGVPRETFEAGGRAQFVRLLNHGLIPVRVLDIGCGCLRVAYWLVRFLDSDCYYGIEPACQRVGYGKRYLFASDELERKRRMRASVTSRQHSTHFGATLCRRAGLLAPATSQTMRHRRVLGRDQSRVAYARSHSPFACVDHGMQPTRAHGCGIAGS